MVYVVFVLLEEFIDLVEVLNGDVDVVEVVFFFYVEYDSDFVDVLLDGDCLDLVKVELFFEDFE